MISLMEINTKLRGNVLVRLKVSDVPGRPFIFVKGIIRKERKINVNMFHNDFRRFTEDKRPGHIYSQAKEDRS